MDMILDALCLTGVAGAAAAALDVEPPRSAASPLETVVKGAERAFRGEKADRVLLYNPDAVALWLYQKYTPFFQEIMLRTQLAIPLRSVMPSVTPVCFASMYTGAMPAVHGIQAYEKPVLRTDTLFDALIRAGKRPAIVSTEGDSISKIFLEREMDYFLYQTPEECNQKALELIAEDRHDLITVYNGDYDAAMHRCSPEGEQALETLRRNAAAFAELSDAAERCWGGHNTLTAFAPDHGCHEIDGRLGSHGLEMEADMNIIHFYGFQPRKRMD